MVGLRRQSIRKENERPLSFSARLSAMPSTMTSIVSGSVRAAFLLAFVCLGHALTPAPVQIDECFSNAECPLTHFFRIFIGDNGALSGGCNFAFRCRLNKCVPRAGVGKKCAIGVGDCPIGLFCLQSPAVPNPLCAPPEPLGGRCWVGLMDNCVKGQDCIPTSGGFGKCGLSLGGKDVGAECRLGGGECHKGLFCLSTPVKPTPVCTPQVAFGGRCWMDLAGNCFGGLDCIRWSGNFGECLREEEVQASRQRMS